MDLYLFDFDKTLYAYDFRKRLPALARLTGASQYHLAKTWWAGGWERRAESGEWATAQEYLERWSEVTGTTLTLDQWCEARHEASTPNPGVVEVLRRCAGLGAVSLFSNNPPPFVATLARKAPDVAEILGPNVLVSCEIKLRKPDPASYRAVLDHYATAAADAFFVDDSGSNVEGARAVGITAFQYTGDEVLPDLAAAVSTFAAREK